MTLLPSGDIADGICTFGACVSRSIAPVPSAACQKVATILSYRVATSDGTATAGQDYVATNGTLLFSPGVTSQVVAVPVLGDLLNEANEIIAILVASRKTAMRRGTP